jgi:membrane protease YdiL (CAAX protease family)
MTELARLFRLDNQHPLVQMIAAIVISVVGGTLIFMLAIRAGAFIFSVPADAMIAAPVAGAGDKEIRIIRFTQSVQQISLFILPSLLIILMVRKRGESVTGMNILPRYADIIALMLLALTVMPVTTYLGYLNAGIDLPEWLSGAEQWIAAREDEAGLLTGYLLVSHDFMSLLVTLLIMAVIPAIGEELYFRGVLQQLLEKTTRSPHLAIWIISILFSAIHMQFYGFIPRLLLGLIFGYLFYWSRNLWMPVIAHFMNNAIPVLLSFSSVPVDSQKGSPVDYLKEIPPPVVQLLIVALILWYLRRSLGSARSS